MREEKPPYHICPCQKKVTAWCKYFVLFLPFAILSFLVKGMNKQEENMVLKLFTSFLEGDQYGKVIENGFF